jgi:hypothetical protein
MERLKYSDILRRLEGFDPWLVRLGLLRYVDPCIRIKRVGVGANDQAKAGIGKRGHMRQMIGWQDAHGLLQQHHGIRIDVRLLCDLLDINGAGTLSIHCSLWGKNKCNHCKGTACCFHRALSRSSRHCVAGFYQTSPPGFYAGLSVLMSPLVGSREWQKVVRGRRIGFSAEPGLAARTRLLHF